MTKFWWNNVLKNVICFTVWSLKLQWSCIEKDHCRNCLSLSGKKSKHEIPGILSLGNLNRMQHWSGYSVRLKIQHCSYVLQKLFSLLYYDYATSTAKFWKTACRPEFWGKSVCICIRPFTFWREAFHYFWRCHCYARDCLKKLSDLWWICATNVSTETCSKWWHHCFRHTFYCSKDLPFIYVSAVVYIMLGS